jgi:crotonobetainyl-CoA:carnitine CoA-transferase CaiB-like acyl-CoA transferase
MAAGGLMYLCGDRDRPPVRVTTEQAYAQAGLQAATGSLVALAHAAQTGEGLHVDVSVQAALLPTMANNRLHWPASQIVTHRAGGSRAFGQAGNRLVFRTADGHVGFMQRSETMVAMARWLGELGITLPFDVAAWQGLPLYGRGSAPAEQVAALEEALVESFARRRKGDLQREAQGHGLILAAVATMTDLVESEHLAAHAFFTEVEYPGWGRTLRVPGKPFAASATPWRMGRAPRLGEDNLAVYGDELGLSRAEIVALKGAGAI